jgi:AraC family transcriptional regulator, regulatory protein of adaptative response / DNA-3-methyladenine glycosylase II
MSVEAVVTTGIYCRPGCPGRPDPRNTRRYGSAAEAEANGFRACLRCRPYRDETTVDVVRAPELVCRGVQLILAGALDGGNEADLAARLGASPRHLRRLFVEQVGVTPDRLARSRRAHFARRLLDDTDLPITQVAYAAGFGSGRQFNRTMTDVFRATPSELRARRRVPDRLVADGGLAVRLPFRAPFDWGGALDYLAARAIRGVECVAGGVYRRTVEIDGDPGVLEVEPGGPDHLLLRAHLPHWEGLIHVVARARRIFGLDADPRVPGALGDAPVIGALVRNRPGLRVPGTWDPFEIGVRAIVGQQVSVAAAGTITARIVERHGTPVAGLGAFGLSARFPRPEVLADAALDDVGLTTSRAAAIRAFSEAVGNGKLALDRSAPLDDLVAAISGLDGLGPWTAQYVALRLGEPDAFPATDLGLRRVLERLTGRPLGPRDVATLAERWRPWRAAAAMHLWTSVRPVRGPAAGGNEQTFATLPP